MAEKKSFLQTAFNLLLMVPKFFGLMELSALIAAEARLAVRTMLYLTVLALLLALLIMTSWISLLAMLLIYLIVTLNISLLLSALIIFILNLTLMAVVLFIMYRMKKNFSFYETRESCKRICRQ